MLDSSIREAFRASARIFACSVCAIALLTSAGCGERGKTPTESGAGSRSPATAIAAGTPRTFAEIDFVWIPPGQFGQGAPRSNGALPQRMVEISRGFWLGIHEITQGQWEAVMGPTDAQDQQTDVPVVPVPR
ncbi:MAG: formylglycine-generating enzyme family protein, partial [bacterium]|nr:formylglycine-generating enzyme family protein [bacterium]